MGTALAGTASAGWRDLRVDGSREAAFAQSLQAFKEQLSPARREVFGAALKDTWAEGTRAAEAAGREYTANDYYGQVDGLGYDEVVNYTDPTGDTAKRRYKDAKAAAAARYASSRPANGVSRPVIRNPSGDSSLMPVYGGITYRGGPQARAPGEY